MAHTFKSPQAVHTLDKAGSPGSGLSSRTAVPSVSRLLGSYCQFHPKADLPCGPQKCCMHAKLLQLCTTLHDSMVQPTGWLLCPWDSPGKDTGVGCHFLLQGIFPTQGSNPRLLRLPALAGGFFTTSATWEARRVSSF